MILKLILVIKKKITSLPEVVEERVSSMLLLRNSGGLDIPQNVHNLK